MARKFGQIDVNIWNDDDFLDLTFPAQWLYLHLATREQLSYAGVMDWRPKHIAPKANGLTIGTILDAADELAEHRYLVIDDDTEEVLVRSFVRNDGMLKQRNMGAAVAKAHGAVGSRILQGVIVHELNRLRTEEPTLAGWEGLKQTLEGRSVDPSTMAPDKAPAKGSSKGSVKGSPKGSVSPSDDPPF